ncbi:MAG: CvpA family protein [Thermoplasmata archaeon]|nr:CvpA family protein [Thermoplasmata archaeon]
MAKRRKTPEEEEKELFKEPEFDVVEFLKSELKKAKGIIVVFLLAVFIGFISGYIQVLVSTALAAIVGFATLFALKPLLHRLNAEFQKRNDWVYAIITFLLIWFLAWTVAINPPFNDVSPPQIRSVEVYNGTAWITIYSFPQEISKNIKSIKWNEVEDIRVKVTDNVEVTDVTINGKTAVIKNGYYEPEENIQILGKIEIQAWDKAGHKTTLKITVPTGT